MLSKSIWDISNHLVPVYVKYLYDVSIFDMCPSNTHISVAPYQFVFFIWCVRIITIHLSIS